MNDFVTIGLILIAWIALNRWILPAMGIQTCMSGGCCGDSCRVPVSHTPPANSEASADQESGSHPKALQDAASDGR